MSEKNNIFLYFHLQNIQEDTPCMVKHNLPWVIMDVIQILEDNIQITIDENFACVNPLQMGSLYKNVNIVIRS